MAHVDRKRRSRKLRSSQVDDADHSAPAPSSVESMPSAGSAMSSVKNGKGTVPLFSLDEVAQFTVRMVDIETNLPAVLEQHGCAIVSGVASDEECSNLERLFARDLIDMVDIAAAKQAGGNVQKTVEKLAEDVRAWPLASMDTLGRLDRCQLRGLPHGRFAWQCRLHQNVRRCYEVIHGTSDLVSSCDNPFFSPPASEEQHQNRSWPHVDHNFHDKRFFDSDGNAVGDWAVFQGILYVWSSESSHASTTVVLPGSHGDAYDAMMHDPYMIKRGQKGVHFCQVSALSQAEMANSLQGQWDVGARRVPVPRGGLFLWSSRTLHQGWTGGPRLAQPVCWEPSGRRDEQALDRKLRLAALGLPSTHWASLGIPHNLVAAEPCKPTAASTVGGSIRLPARASIRQASLKEGVEEAAMWSRLAGIDWTSPMPIECRQFVEDSLTEEVLEAL